MREGRRRWRGTNFGGRGQAGNATLVLAGRNAPSSSSNRRGDLLAWSMTPEIHTGRQFTALRSDI